MQHVRTKHPLLYRLFPIPTYLTLDTVGIDISPKSVCAMKLSQGKAGLVPTLFKEELLSDECELLESKDDLKRCEPLRVALLKMKEELKLRFVKVSLPEMKTYIFKTSLPHEALATIEDALTVKLQENVPLDPNEILYDFQILPMQKNQRMIDVVVTVFPKNVITTYTDLLYEVGLVPIAFESESQSNARAVVGQHDDTPYLLMHMGYTKVNLAIVERGVVHYTSSIPYPSEEIIKDFASQPALALRAKINTLLVYWFTNKHNPEVDEQISNTIVTGPFASAPGLIEFLEKGVRINVDTANVWRNCFDINEYVPDIPQDTALRFSTAIGLALLKQ
jgi:Tfp pilus assembly PilM family ATPase